VARFGHSVEPNPPNNVLFVGNLPWSATKEELQELFADFGEVTAVRIREWFSPLLSLFWFLLLIFFDCYRHSWGWETSRIWTHRIREKGASGCLLYIRSGGTNLLWWT
jgi:RNA recognition motif-containing protein